MTKLGFAVEVFSRTREGKARGWQGEGSDFEAVALLAIEDGSGQSPRFLERPTIRDRPVKDSGAPALGKD
jgi:hypothetical protein